MFDLGLDLPRVALLIPASLAAGGVVLEATIFRRKTVSPMAFGVVLAMLLVVYSCVLAIGLPLLERARPTAAIAENLRPRLAPDDQVGLYRLEKWRFSLRYYLERPLSKLQEPSDVKEFLHKKGSYILLSDEDLARLRHDGVNLRAVSERPAVTGTTGRGLRRQKWGSLGRRHVRRHTEDNEYGALGRNMVRGFMMTKRALLATVLSVLVAAAVMAADRQWQSAIWRIRKSSGRK
jgi:hypothetical protein